jgi:hypothetical protein
MATKRVLRGDYLWQHVATEIFYVPVKPMNTTGLTDEKCESDGNVQSILHVFYGCTYFYT